MSDQKIDGYSHIGLPRFQSAETALYAMDENAIGKALACPFETCPDIGEVHRAFVLAPGRIRPFGLALGRDRTEVEAGLHAQFDAGFQGMRLALERIGEAPYILDAIGSRQGTPLVVGNDALASQARRLIDFLEAHGDCVVISPHMAGPTSPDVFATDAAVRALFTHERFHVVASRQTLFDPGTMTAWGHALIEHVGWDRLMWGSEAPVLLWRDETLEQASDWIEQFSPSPSQRAAFFHGNAERVIFGAPARDAAELKLPYEPLDFEIKAPAPMWPHGFGADTRVPAPLVAAWMRDGGLRRGPLSAYVSELLLEALSRRQPNDNKEFTRE